MLYDKRWDAPAKTKPTYRDVLLQIAEEIRKRGHCADGAETSDGRVCIMAAWGHARETLGILWDKDLYFQTLDAMKREVGNEHPITWNYKQDAQSVIAMLEKAAK